MANRKFEFDTDGFQYYNDNYVKHPSKSATTGTSGAHPYNGMGRVVLKKNMVSNVNTLTQAMINTSNTIYVIKYDYVLGANITVPANCVLEFDGGSLSGEHTITGVDTDIVADSVKIIDTSITLAGTWKCVFNLCWFGLSQSNIDNGTIINNIHIPSGITAIIPEGNYTFTTPVLMPSFKSFTFYGNLRYTGTQTNTPFIKMGGFGVYNFLGEVSCESQSINYTNANNSNIIGIEIYNAECCEFTIANIYGFNENVRVSAYGNVGDGGCARNTFNILENRKANKHIRIYQEDVDSSHYGWVNENRFYLGRQAVDADVYAAGSVHLLYADLSGKLNISDDNIFYGTYEVAQFSNVIPIYLNNVQYFRFYDIRHEGATKLAKIAGNCYNLVFDVTYGKSEIFGNWYDLSECNTQPFDPDFMVKNFAGEISLIDKNVVDGSITSEWYGFLNVRTNPSNVVKASIDANNDVVFNTSVYGGQEIPCMFVDSSVHKMFYLENMQSGQYSNIFISYARNSNGELITKNGNDNYANDLVKVGEKYLFSSYSPSSSAGTHLIGDDQTYRIQRRISFRIPDDITGFYITLSSGFNRFRLYSLAISPSYQTEPKVLKRLV